MSTIAVSGGMSFCVSRPRNPVASSPHAALLCPESKIRVQNPEPESQPA